MIRRLTLCLAAMLLCCSVASLAADSLERNFISPPASARPWVYWFWLNGNITREGVTADLEAMKRVGIGGVLIMEVDQGAPVGPADFMSPQWRALFGHAVSEAGRLGLEINMNNDAGWNGSGGPWIKPEQSMQNVVFTETEVTGPQRFDAALPRPAAVADYYRDITVLAFPATGAYRIPGIQGKAAYEIGATGPSKEPLPDEMVIDRDRITDISAHMDTGGRLAWDVPPGKWTIARFGHTSTGAQNHPAPATGRGLECDKLSKEGSEAHFNGMMAKLIADSGPAAGKALVATHVDSWEIGSQNWTARMREEFRRLRGYDMLPYLPVMTGRVVGGLEVSERFLWDLRKTVSELVIENYAGHIRDLAHAGGLRFTIEAYGGPCDSIPYGGQADEPMGEFWAPRGAMETCRSMASSAHVYGKPIVGAEAFTAWGDERWLKYPAAIKAVGDEAFCLGINRFVFHRYAMQPWAPERKPGMTMGPWGQHYERTQTWWELTPAWHTYLARCQYLLRQGLFAADVCYLQAEAPPQGWPKVHQLRGYGWDECGAEVVLTRMSVKNGRIVLPGGMSYRALVLPNCKEMTPLLLSKIRDLVHAGATVLGAPPSKSPSLSDYPNCDRQVKRIAAELWGDCDGEKIKEHRFGRGLVVMGAPVAQFLAQTGAPPDFTSGANLRYIHRVAGGTDIYFVSNPQPGAVRDTCAFRVSGKVPELWWPDTGRIERAPVFDRDKGATHVALSLEPSGSVFVIFRKSSAKSDQFVTVTHDGKTVVSAATQPAPRITVLKAVYGVLDDPARTRDVRARVRRALDEGERSFLVSLMAQDDDPAYGIVKTLVIDYTLDGNPYTVTGKDPDIIDMASPAAGPAAPVDLHGSHQGLMLTAWQPGSLTLSRASGKKTKVVVPALPPPIAINGPWTITFPPDSGAPDKIETDRLISWPDHSDAGVKYFSGTATYRTTFDVPESALAKSRVALLDLGDVQALAQVKLNGRDLGVLWKPPFSMMLPLAPSSDARSTSKGLRAGKNELEVKVTNLWPNRMIGDEYLPEDSDRNPDGTLKSWPQWLQEGKPSPTGRHTFTSWRLWGKSDTLLKSGLLGPVTLQVGQEIRVR
ncbi:MAG: glycosyl hydrolase [Armatimonadota bacterium]|nr:glycosyl hydrolase [Armatimonadota bacterium]